MSSDWYCLIGDREYGPLDGKKLRQLARTGRIGKLSPVRKGKDGPWVAAERVRGLFTGDAVRKQQSESFPQIKTAVAPPLVESQRTPRHFSTLAGIAAASVIFAAIGLAFYLGRQSASQISRSDEPAAVKPTPATIVEPVDPEIELTRSAEAARLAKPADSSQPVAADTAMAPFERQFEQAAATRKAIIDAEKSVALVEVKGNLSADDCSGSGFLIGNGILVTNYHVIEGGRSVYLTFPGGRKVPGVGWLAFDRERDLALIACDSGNLPPLKMAIARPNKLDAVYTIGSPHELSGTMSTGIVSGIRIDKTRGKERVLIQTTAAISHGNSGGPLLSDKGEAIGATFMFLEGGQNLNFAVAAEHIADLLVVAEKTPRPWHALPAPQKPPAEKPRVDPTAEWIAKQNAAAAAAAQEKHAQTVATQRELDRIVARAGQLTQAIAVIEAEGTALTRQRDQIHATMFQAASNALVANSAANQIRWEDGNSAAILDAATADGVVDVLSLRQQFDAICQQINYKAQQRDQLSDELNALRKKYEELRVK